MDVEQLGAADEIPLQLGLISVLGHLLDGRKHFGLQLVQHVGDDPASPWRRRSLLRLVLR
jgi:hypothetical protein